MAEPTKLKVKTQADVAEAYAVAVDTVKRWRSEGMPGKNGCYVLGEISAWLRTEGPWKPHAKPQSIPGDDPLLADGDSPALERYRLAKAKHAELDLEERRARLIDREKCREVLARWAAEIRLMGERLAKQHGNEAAETVNDALDECKSIVIESLSETGDADD